MTTGNLESLSIPLRACTSWCEDGDGHGDLHPDDRSCWSTYNVVPLTTHDAEQSFTAGGGEEWLKPWLNVYLRWRPEDASPLAYVHSEENDYEIKLTLGEATQLRDYLTELLATAGQS